MSSAVVRHIKEPAGVAIRAFYRIRSGHTHLYKSGSGLYIETKYCYHYTYGEDAALKWEGKYSDNKIIWDEDSKCDVKIIWK